MALLISIITVSYNSASTIRDTIESVLNQTYNNIEYILIDANSKDETIEIIKLYKQKFKEKKIIYKWISEPDKGIYDAMNKGILMATGDIIGIINSDDWYSKDAVSEIVKINKNYTYSIISGNKNKVNFNKKVLSTDKNKNVSEYIHKKMPLNHPATFVHKSVYKKIGLFDLQYKLSADYDFIFRAHKLDCVFLFTDKVIVNMRNSGATYQIKNIFITAKEDYEIRKKYNVKLALFYYVKKLGFNYLIIIRDILRRLF